MMNFVNCTADLVLFEQSVQGNYMGRILARIREYIILVEELCEIGHMDE